MTSVTVTPVPRRDEFSYDFDGFNVRINVHGDTISTAELLILPDDDETMNEVLGTHAGLMAWAGVLAADAESDADEFKYLVEIAEADADRQLREVAEAEGEKVTEPLMKHRVNTHPDVVEAQERYFHALRRARTMKNLYEAFKARGEMIRTVSANRRAEKDQPS